MEVKKCSAFYLSLLSQVSLLAIFIDRHFETNSLIQVDNVRHVSNIIAKTVSI